MSILLSSKITAIGPDVAELLEGGVLILFADGCPPELAEVSVSHIVAEATKTRQPKPGDQLRIGSITARVTAVGELAWDKMTEMGHVVFNFGGSNIAERPGEICVSAVDRDHLWAALNPGATITIETI